MLRPLERIRHEQLQREAAERMQREDPEQYFGARGGSGGESGEGGHGRHRGGSSWRTRTAGSQYGGGSRMARDFLGYYKLLGVDLSGGRFSVASLGV